MPGKDKPRDDLPSKEEWIAQAGKNPDDIGDGCRNTGTTATDQDRARQEREPD